MNPCDLCDREFETPHGLNMHKARSHRPPAPSLEEADNLFETVGRATEVLFPRGIPPSRVIEIAEWQKITLKLLKR